MDTSANIPANRTVLRVFQSKAETQAFYNKIAKIYDLMAEHSEEPVRQQGLEKLHVQPNERVLEIGCGTGHCLIDIARAAGAGGKACGLDISEEMLKLTRELASNAGFSERVDLHCGDASKFPFPDGTFDAIFMSFTLELFDTPEIPVVLAECRRVLRRGARIVVVGMSKQDAHGMVFELYEWSHRHFPNFMDCRPIFVRRSLEAAGFTAKESIETTMWVPVEIVLAVKE